MDGQLTDSDLRLRRIANSLTIARIALAPLVAWLILYRNPWWFSCIFLFVLGLTDRVDGDIARKVGPTRRGAFLDTLADKVLLLFAGYALVVEGSFWWLPMTLIAIRELGMMAYRIYWSRFGLSVPARLSGKYKAIMQGFALLGAMFPPLEDRPDIVSMLLWVAVAFTVVSAVQYVLDGRKALSTTGERTT